ncbi:MAG: hypothetical protein KDK97_21295, partial [Verrucomicrobiales bacterium]|nr:hypothetical protein [Verrucomicrobiales bacterium]
MSPGVKQFVLLGTAWIALMMPIPLPPFGLWGPLIVIGLMVWAIQLWRRSLSGKVWLLLLLSLHPIGFAVASGFVAYAGGAPSLWIGGYAFPQMVQVDRETRAFFSGGGCLITGNEWIVEKPHNTVVATLCHVLGPP